MTVDHSGVEPESSSESITRLYSLDFTVSFLVFYYIELQTLGLLVTTETPPLYFDKIKKTNYNYSVPKSVNNSAQIMQLRKQLDEQKKLLSCHLLF